MHFVYSLAHANSAISVHLIARISTTLVPRSSNATFIASQHFSQRWEEHNAPLKPRLWTLSDGLAKSGHGRVQAPPLA